MRSTFITITLLTTALISASAFSAEHPHDKEKETAHSKMDDFAAKLEKRFSKYKSETPSSKDKSIDKEVRVFKFESGDDIRDMSKDFESMIAESGIISDLADMVADFAEEIEIEKGEKSFAFRFDGDTLGEMKHDGDKTIVLKSMGKDMRIERETYEAEGETRTRIIIDMAGDGSDVDLDSIVE